MNAKLISDGVNKAMWLTIGCLLLVMSAVASAQQEAVGDDQTQSESTGLTSFKYKEQRLFRMDIPSRWIAETTDNAAEIARYSSNEQGSHKVKIFRYFNPREDAVMRHQESLTKSWQEHGHTNLVRTETTLEVGEALVLDSEYTNDKDNRVGYIRTYNIQAEKHLYTVAFSTDNKDMFGLFEEMANSIRVSTR